MPGERRHGRSGSPSASLAEALLDAAPDAMVVVGAGGRIVLVNAEAERLFGYPRRELLGQLIEVLIPERLRERHTGHRAAGAARRPMHSGTVLTAIDRAGREFPVEVSLSPVETEDGVVVATAVRDISERRRFEQAIVEANRMKSQFLANMSHELRTPLNAIVGFSDLMHKGRVGAVSEEQREYLGDILVSARHLLQLINDVLDLAKIESGKMEFRPETVDLTRLVGEVRDVLRGLTASKRIRIETCIEPSLGTVFLDPARLKQVLYNYLSNAIKFTPESGRIQVRIAAEGPDDFRVDVEDNGIGIRPEDLARLFVEFQQLDASTAKKYQGTGLGLSLTRSIVTAQGGRVEVASAPGQGSTFSAILPRRAPAIAEAAGGSTDGR
jgi:PAS domain S-box-containing protein